MVSALVLCIALTGMDEPLILGPPERIANGFVFTEGPAWSEATGLLFSDIPADTIYRADKSVFRRPSGNANGLTFDTEGRLIACEHGNRRVSRTEPDGSVHVLAERFEGQRLNSPNDAVVRSDGTIFFTDPPYGLEGRAAELPFSGVYAITHEGTLRLLAKDMGRPNGIALSRDERTLYIAESRVGFIRAYDVAADATLFRGRLFAEVPGCDGIAVDVDGRVWTTATEGIRVYTAAGTLIATVPVPAPPSNCVFGDADRKTLYITARDAVYRLRCGVAGFSAARR